MKKILVFTLLVLVNVLSFSQVTPEAFISMLPAIPTNCCEDNKESREEFFTTLDSVSFLIDNELARRDEESENSSEDFEKQNMNKIANQYGLSQEELERLQKDENLSEEEQAELINKVMKKKDDISLKEVKNLEKLDKEGRDAWSEAYGDQKMAEVQYDKEKYEEQQIEFKSRYELAALRKHITDSLQAIESKFAQQFEEIENDPERKIMLDNIMKLSEEANNLMGEGNKEKLDSKVETLQLKMDEYCNKFTPKYLEVLRRYETYTKSSLPVCYKLEKIIAQHTKLEFGIEMKQVPGQLGIGKVLGYLGKLRGAYKYNPYENNLGILGIYEKQK